MAGGSTSAAVSMKDYLKRYQSSTEDPTKKKKKKKKVEKPKPSAMGVLVVDEDPVWQKPVQLEEESDSDGEFQNILLKINQIYGILLPLTLKRSLLSVCK
jgi:hypothetical protein